MVDIYNAEQNATYVTNRDGNNEQKTSEDDWYPPTKNKPLPPIRMQGDVSFCDTCKANTVYLGTGCAVCAVPKDDFRLRYSGQAYRFYKYALQ